MKRWAEFGIAGAASLFAMISAAGLEGAQRLPVGLPPSATLLLRYDANSDTNVTKDEVEAGLKQDFAAADTNGDGCLDGPEMRAENERRLTRDSVQASPLVDWNLNGCVDAREFSNTVRNYFDLADRTKDGRVSPAELRGPSMPLAPPGGATKRPGMDSYGSTTQTPTNPATGLPY